jgi:hypothetical protein
MARLRIANLFYRVFTMKFTQIIWLLFVGCFYSGAVVTEYTEAKKFWSSERVIKFYSDTCAEFEWDGQGQEVDFSNTTLSVGTGLWISNPEFKHSGCFATPSLLIKNVTLKNFNSWKVTSLQNKLHLSFGDGVSIHLGADEKLAMNWHFVGKDRQKCARVNGCGYLMDLCFERNCEKMIFVASQTEVVFENFTDFKIKNTRSAQSPVLLFGDDSIVTLRNLHVSLEGNVYFNKGVVAIVDEVQLSGAERSFVLSGSAQLLVMPKTTFLISEDVFFETRYARKNAIVLFDETARLFFKNSTLYGWKNGPRFENGIIVIDGSCAISTDIVGDRGAVQFVMPEDGDENCEGAKIESLTGSVLNLYGAVAVVSSAGDFMDKEDEIVEGEE